MRSHRKLRSGFKQRVGNHEEFSHVAWKEVEEAGGRSEVAPV